MERITRHPLEAVSAGREQAPPPPEDQTPPSFPDGAMPLTRERLKREVGRHVYPFKNRVERPIVERRLRAAGVELGARRRPEVLTWGNKGMGVEIFLAEARRRIGPVNRAICFGSGLGTELLNVAKIVRPKQILAFEYMNYRRAWDWVVREASALGVEARFVQRDLRNAVGAAPGEIGDVLFSFAVLEHLRDMRESLGHLRSLIRPDGWFAAHWGPMWNSYGGDHIAPEVGFDHGYDQVLLSPSDYLSFYRAHPRNLEHVKSGRPTWWSSGSRISPLTMSTSRRSNATLEGYAGWRGASVRRGGSGDRDTLLGGFGCSSPTRTCRRSICCSPALRC
jgi:SAM-dependent methyltransferase